MKKSNFDRHYEEYRHNQRFKGIFWMFAILAIVVGATFAITITNTMTNQKISGNFLGFFEKFETVEEEFEGAGETDFVSPAINSNCTGFLDCSKYNHSYQCARCSQCAWNITNNYCYNLGSCSLCDSKERCSNCSDAGCSWVYEIEINNVFFEAIWKYCSESPENFDKCQEEGLFNKNTGYAQTQLGDSSMIRGELAQNYAKWWKEEIYKLVAGNFKPGANKDLIFILIFDERFNREWFA